MVLTTWFLGWVGIPVAALLVYIVLKIVDSDDKDI